MGLHSVDEAWAIAVTASASNRNESHRSRPYLLRAYPISNEAYEMVYDYSLWFINLVDVTCAFSEGNFAQREGVLIS